MYPQCDLTREIIASAIAVHKNLGPGLLESVYQLCLGWEFDYRKIRFQREVDIPFSYRGNRIDRCFRLDFLVEGQVVIEIKAVDVLLPVHEAQILTYLRLTNMPIGLLLNFNVSILKTGIRRYILTRDNKKENMDCPFFTP
jgi:GxxExxY protein